MKLAITIFGLFLFICILIGQQLNKETKNEIEFHQLISKSKVTQEINKVAIQATDKKTGEIITKTANQIVSLKNEVKQLKTELNEANQKLDSINSNTGVKFSFSAISNGEKDR